MPIRDPEKRRAYQRAWSKARTRITVPKKCPIKEAERTKDWHDCVAKAKALPLVRANRVVIGQLAEQACDHAWGGDRRMAGPESRRSIRRFAQEIGVHHKTLWAWATLYREIASKLSEKEIDFGAAELAVKNHRRANADILTLYQKYANKSDPSRSALRARIYARGIMKHLSQFGLNGFLGEQANALTALAEKIQEAEKKQKGVKGGKSKKGR